MSSNRLNKIFNSSKNISRSEISKYGNSKDERFKQRIEEKSMADNFNSDAFDGWQEMSHHLHYMKKADRRFHRNLYLKYYFIGFVALLIFSIPVYFILKKDNNSVQEINSFVPNESTIITDKKEKDSIVIDVSEVFISENIEQMKPASKKNQVAPTTLKNEFKEINDFREQNYIQPLPLKKITLNKKSNQLEKRQFAKEIYLHNLKLVDYREYRSAPSIKTKQLILSGTPANKEDIHSESFDTEWKTVEVPYIEFIDKTMSVTNDAHYKKALMRFETILETYPEDVNAHFYAGLCLYNLGEYSDALVHFNKCIINDFQNFDEEAEWLQASCLDQLKRDSEADKIYQLIVSRKGFYASQAKERLK